MGQSLGYPVPIQKKEVLFMKTIKAIWRSRKPLSPQATQVLYGVSILATFLVAGRFSALV